MGITKKILACVQTSPFPLLHAERDVCVMPFLIVFQYPTVRVFEFRINYGVVVFVARPLNCNFYQSFKTIFPSDRSKITGLTGEMGTVVTG